MSIHDKRDSIGRAGLMSLMGDPRYTDANHPEHDRVVDLIRRGFEMVMGEADARGFTTLFDNDVAGGRRIDLMNSDARADFGRGLLLRAIRAEGATMPVGLRQGGCGSARVPNPPCHAKDRRGPGKVRAGGAADRPTHRRSQGAATAAETVSTATGDTSHARPTGLTGRSCTARPRLQA